MASTRAGLSVLLLSGVLGAQVTERANVSSLGIQANDLSDLPQLGDFVSADGRFVVFRSYATNLVPGDTNVGWDIFVRDRLTRTTELLSVDSAGNQCNGGCGLFGITITPDGRYVAFYAEATNLVPGDTNGAGDIFLRDRLLGTTERVSLAWNGAQGNGTSYYPAISDDARFVAFASYASNLVSGDTNGAKDIFLRDRIAGTTERVSVSSGGLQGNSYSDMPTISADGRLVAFAADASNLVVGDTNGVRDIFVRDRQTGITERVSVATGGGEGNGISAPGSKISGNGRYVVFSSYANNLVPGDTNGHLDVFVHDRRTGITQRASEGPGGIQGNNDSYQCSISADGRFVAFYTQASNFFPSIFAAGILVRDMLNGTVEDASVSTNGDLSTGLMPSISAGGRYVVFRSNATNLVPGDTNGWDDAFIHDRLASGFTSTCDPGLDNVIPCPCGNPPSGSLRGCDNSSFTGGASLAATGIAYLSIDSLVFTTNGETPSATSMLLQGDAPIPTGLVFGQGVRCAGGALKRMYVKSAAGGSITAPDLGAGDPTVSSRSAFLGSPIQPGQASYYLVYYRDSTVLGGCSAMSTFNTTQTGQISWWP
jgi:Tol biopolymer transport system component